MVFQEGVHARACTGGSIALVQSDLHTISGKLPTAICASDVGVFSVGWFVLSIYSAGRDGGTSLKVTLTPRSELSCVVRTRSKSLRAQTPRVPLGKR